MSFNALIAYVYFGCTSVLLLAMMALFVQRLSSSRTATLFARFVWALTAWAASDVLELLGPSEVWSEFWYGTFRSTAVCLSSVAWVWFCIEYARCQENRLASIVKWAVMIAGCMWVFVCWTPLRSVLFSELRFQQQQWLWAPVTREIGPWFGGYFTFGVTCSLLGLAVLAIYVFRTGPLSRWQVLSVATAGALSSLIAICTGCGLLGMPMLDKTVFALPITVLMFAISLQRLGFLQASPVLLQALINNIPVGIWALDREGYLVDANGEGIEILTSTEQGKHRRQSPLFQKVTDTVPEGSPLRDIALESDASRQERILDQKTGQRIYCVDTIPLLDKYRTRQGTLIVFRNETALRKRMEDLDAYAHRAAHDLKGPLAAILNMAALIQLQSETSDDTQQLGSEISEVVRSMDQIIKEMLLVASMQDGDDSHLVPLNVAECAKSAMCRLSLNEENICLDSPEEWTWALGRTTWVEEILSNFIANAIEHAGNSELRVALSCEDLGEFVEYSVADNGPGLHPDTASKLFKSQQPSPNESGHPRGLGLSIVRRLVEKQGGSLGYRRGKEQGGAFWFQLKSCPSPKEALE